LDSFIGYAGTFDFGSGTHGAGQGSGGSFNGYNGGGSNETPDCPIPINGGECTTAWGNRIPISVYPTILAYPGFLLPGGGGSGSGGGGGNNNTGRGCNQALMNVGNEIRDDAAAVNKYSVGAATGGAALAITGGGFSLFGDPEIGGPMMTSGGSLFSAGNAGIAASGWIDAAGTVVQLFAGGDYRQVVEDGTEIVVTKLLPDPISLGVDYAGGIAHFISPISTSQSCPVGH
jgi:hypothetical protein